MASSRNRSSGDARGKTLNPGMHDHHGRRRCEKASEGPERGKPEQNALVSHKRGWYRTAWGNSMGELVVCRDCAVAQ